MRDVAFADINVALYTYNYSLFHWFTGSFTKSRESRGENSQDVLQVLQKYWRRLAATVDVHNTSRSTVAREIEEIIIIIIIYLFIKHTHIEGRKQDSGTGQQATHSTLTVGLRKTCNYYQTFAIKLIGILYKFAKKIYLSCDLVFLFICSRANGH